MWLRSTSSYRKRSSRLTKWPHRKGSITLVSLLHYIYAVIWVGYTDIKDFLIPCLPSTSGSDLDKSCYRGEAWVNRQSPLMETLDLSSVSWKPYVFLEMDLKMLVWKISALTGLLSCESGNLELLVAVFSGCKEGASYWRRKSGRQ